MVIRHFLSFCFYPRRSRRVCFLREEYDFGKGIHSYKKGPGHRHEPDTWDVTYIWHNSISETKKKVCCSNALFAPKLCVASKRWRKKCLVQNFSFHQLIVILNSTTIEKCIHYLLWLTHRFL